MRALAVDLGGSHATCAEVEDRTLIGSRTLSVNGRTNLKSLLPLISRTLREVHSEKSGLNPSALVVGFCGIVDHFHNRILSSKQKFDDASSLDLERWCRDEFDLPLKLENDARLALLGKRYAGAAQGYNDVVMVTLGTGIGGAAMCDGRLLRGKHSQAGCLGGHMPVDFEGRTCTCGAIGCAEAEASSVTLPDICRSHPLFRSSRLAAESSITYEKLFLFVERGDRLAQEVADRCLRVWATTIVALVHAYDPEIVVVGGGVMKSAARILPVLQSYVARYAWTPWGKVRVTCSQLGSNAPLFGAIPLLQGSTEI